MNRISLWVIHCRWHTSHFFLLIPTGTLGSELLSPFTTPAINPILYILFLYKIPVPLVCQKPPLYNSDYTNILNSRPHRSFVTWHPNSPVTGIYRWVRYSLSSPNSCLCLRISPDVLLHGSYSSSSTLLLWQKSYLFKIHTYSTISYSWHVPYIPKNKEVTPFTFEFKFWWTERFPRDRGEYPDRSSPGDTPNVGEWRSITNWSASHASHYNLYREVSFNRYSSRTERAPGNISFKSYRSRHYGRSGSTDKFFRKWQPKGSHRNPSSLCQWRDESLRYPRNQNKKSVKIKNH